MSTNIVKVTSCKGHGTSFAKPELLAPAGNFEKLQAGRFESDGTISRRKIVNVPTLLPRRNFLRKSHDEA
ncbi:MAG: hypothetical protein IJ774_02800 [Selenomonadaceae bacterium]|nr:hypothetical protein [Selenomonadaceae bacterium]